MEVKPLLEPHAGWKVGVRKGKDCQGPGPCLGISSQWDQLSRGCRFSVRGSLGSLGLRSPISPVRGEAWVPAYLEPFLQVALMHIRIENYPF